MGSFGDCSIIHWMQPNSLENNDFGVKHSWFKKSFLKISFLFQKLLEALQVSHPKLDEVIRVASSLGLHAKLTGAGGGGFAFILLPPYVKLEIVEQAKDLLTKHGLLCCETALGVDGVKIESIASSWQKQKKTPKHKLKNPVPRSLTKSTLLKSIFLPVNCVRNSILVNELWAQSIECLKTKHS